MENGAALLTVVTLFFHTNEDACRSESSLSTRVRQSPLQQSESTASRRNLLRNKQPTTPMPNGLTSVMSSTTQPWLHSARKHARMLTVSRLAGKKCSQSRRSRGKRCWLTSRTLPQAHATPFEQLGARPSRPQRGCMREHENCHRPY